MAGPVAGVVTPEGVVLQVQMAGPGTRIVAKGLDLLIQFAAIVAFVVAGTALAGGSLGTAGGIVLLFAIPLILFGYPAVMESTWRGRTLGKAALGLRVVTREGAPCRFRHALIRSILYLVDGFLLGPAVGILFLVLTRDTVRLGDLAAGTIVVRERSGAVMPAPAVFIPSSGFEDLAAYLDTTRLSSADYEIVRAVLLRAPRLGGQARWQVAADVAGRIAGLIGFVAPADLHPEVFLQTVAAAYQHRHATTYQPLYPYGAGYGAAPGYGAGSGSGAGPAPVAEPEQVAGPEQVAEPEPVAEPEQVAGPAPVAEPAWPPGAEPGPFTPPG